MSSKIARKLFTRFFLGIATEEEKQSLYDSSDSEELLEREWESFSNVGTNSPLFDKKKTFNSIKQEINNNKQIKPIHAWVKFAQKYAAILIVGLLISGGLTYLGLIKPLITQSAEIIEIYNNEGNPKKITLSDGSIITLNNQSKLLYPKKFGKKNRLVELEGEAFFEIASNENKPFIVKAEDINIEVLGTKFNVNAFSNQDIIETTLVEGSIRVEHTNKINNQTQRVILTPNHKVAYSKLNGRMVMDKVDVTSYKSWVEGILIFDNDPLSEIAKKLEIKYNTKIILSDDVKDRYRYTLTIQNEGIEEVLQILEKTSPVAFSKANDEYLIYSSKN